MSLDISGEHI